MQYLKIFSLLALFLFIVSSAYSEDINSYEYLKLKIENNIQFSVEKEEDFKVSSFYVNSFFFPQTIENSQYLNSFDTTFTNYRLLNESGIVSLRFEYDSQTLKEENEIVNEFIIQSTYHRPEIKKKVVYPLTYVDSRHLPYLGFTELINIDDDIKAQASALASGEDDVFIIASKVAKWIREDVNYDLSTITENPDQTSTEVFDSKAGVCKEITNLYISMMRSLGIPARVVTGYAYTESEEIVTLVGDNWGGHAWAEVLIGDEWIPFDLTYNQYGYVDASHIVLDKYKDVRPSSISLNGSGFGFNLKSGSLGSKTTFEILDKSGNFTTEFDIEISGPDELGFGSYGFIRLDIENPKDYYQILFLRLAKTPEVELLDQDSMMVILEPREEKTTYFRYKLPTGLEDGFIYTFPFTVYNDDIKETLNVKVTEDGSFIKEIGLPEEEEELMTLSQNDVEVDCEVVVEQEYLISCFIRNNNNYEIEDVEICSTKQCKKVDLKLNDYVNVNFTAQRGNETITYQYGEENGSIDLEIVEPFLEISKQQVEEILGISYNVEHHKDSYWVEIYLNGELKKKKEQTYDTVNLGLETGNNTVKVILRNKYRVFDEKSFDFMVEKKVVSQTTSRSEEEGFFHELARKIRKLLSFE